MMSGCATKSASFNKKNKIKIGRPEHSLTPHPPPTTITSHFYLNLPSPLKVDVICVSQPWQLASAHGKCRRKCQGKLLFHCFMSAKFCLRKIFFHHWQKFNSKDKVNLDIYFYFLTLYIHN